MPAARTWLLATRPRTLPAAIVPVAVGTACVAASAHPVHWPAALAALAGAISIQIGTNFANDVFDAERGADGPDRIGPTRAVAAGLISARAMKLAMLAAFATAAIAGLYLVALAGWPVIAIGVASILSGIAYTGGPALGYRGLGDVFVLAFFGFVAVCGTAYVQLDHIPPLAVAASLPVGALATAILVVNNLRDRPLDARAGKRTLAVRFGRRAAIGEYAALLLVAYAVPLALAVTVDPFAALPLATLPLALARLRDLVTAIDGPSFNRCLAATAQLVLVHGALLAVGLAIGAWGS